uniref:Putative secreted protein n=1 Tax=Anopheles darlingi TaxID=43151 RepID=A0A2M4DS06_ANODA
MAFVLFYQRWHWTRHSLLLPFLLTQSLPNSIHSSCWCWWFDFYLKTLAGWLAGWLSSEERGGRRPKTTATAR